VVFEILYQRSRLYNDWPWLSELMLTLPDSN
jgi:hypothetical protein